MKVIELGLLEGADKEDIVKHLGEVMGVLSEASDAIGQEKYRCLHKSLDGESVAKFKRLLRLDATTEEAILNLVTQAVGTHEHLKNMIADHVQKTLALGDILASVTRHHPNRKLALVASGIAAMLKFRTEALVEFAFLDEGFEEPLVPEFYIEGFRQLMVQGPYTSLENFCSSFADAALDYSRDYLQAVHKVQYANEDERPTLKNQAQAIHDLKSKYLKENKPQFTEVARIKN